MKENNKLDKKLLKLMQDDPFIRKTSKNIRKVNKLINEPVLPTPKQIYSSKTSHMQLQKMKDRQDQNIKMRQSFTFQTQMLHEAGMIKLEAMHIDLPGITHKQIGGKQI